MPSAPQDLWIASNKLHAYTPSPAAYDQPNNWKSSILGNMKGGKKNTYIEQICREEKIKPKPGPGAYKPSINFTHKRNSLGVIDKGERVPFTSNAEWLATQSPAGTYTEKIKLPAPFKHNVKKKGWRVQKVDGPDPQSYSLKEAAIDKQVNKVSPSWKQSKDKRKFFTDKAEKKSQQSPGAGMYNTIDYSKIHRRLTTRRH